MYANWVRTMNDVQSTGCTVALPGSTGPTAGMLNMSGYCESSAGFAVDAMLCRCLTEAWCIGVHEQASTLPLHPTLTASLVDSLVSL